jgi:hypothetical protein
VIFVIDSNRSAVPIINFIVIAIGGREHFFLPRANLCRVDNGPSGCVHSDGLRAEKSVLWRHGIK